MHPFTPRPIESLGTLEHEHWRRKRYGIRHPSQVLDPAVFTGGVQLALDVLPTVRGTGRPGVGTGRPGVGFLILHRGASVSYVVLGWWDRENELPLHVFVHPDGEPDGWRRARDGESICVWDMEVLWFERNAYIEHVLGTRQHPGGDLEGYVGRVFGGAPDPDAGAAGATSMIRPRAAG